MKKNYHGFHITTRQGLIILPNRQIDFYWFAEARNDADIYLNSNGRCYPTEEDAILAVANAIDYYRRKHELI